MRMIILQIKLCTELYFINLNNKTDLGDKL